MGDGGELALFARVTCRLTRSSGVLSNLATCTVDRAQRSRVHSWRTLYVIWGHLGAVFPSGTICAFQTRGGWEVLARFAVRTFVRRHSSGVRLKLSTCAIQAVSGKSSGYLVVVLADPTSSQTVAPVPFLYFPWSHDVHEAALATDENLPAVHKLQPLKLLLLPVSVAPVPKIHVLKASPSIPA